jgi:5-methylcytosine-specific restriction endonuclease McrA
MSAKRCRDCFRPEGEAVLVPGDRLCRDCKRALDRQYAAAHRIEAREKSRLWRLNNPGRFSAYQRANPEKFRLYNGKRRALLKAGGTLSEGEWQKIQAEWEHRCAYCRGPGPFEMDHYESLSKGGRHDFWNVVPACRTCNRRKKDADPYEVMTWNLD